MRSIRNIGIDEILNISKSRVDFEFRVSVGEVPPVSKVYIRDRRDNRYCEVLKESNEYVIYSARRFCGESNRKSTQ